MSARSNRSIVECLDCRRDRPNEARGLCSACYIKRKRRGDEMPRRTRDVPFWDRVDKSDGCWLWTLKPNSDGYGVFRSNGADQSPMAW